MPLSSSSLPSLGSAGSASEDIAAPSFVRLAMLSASEAPKTAGGRDRKRRPNSPSNKGERAVDINPRGGSPCLALIKRLLRLVGGRLSSFAYINHNITGSKVKLHTLRFMRAASECSTPRWT